TSMQQEKLLMNFANVFPFFFKEENFEIIGEDMDKYAAISRMCQRLKDNGYVEDEFEQQVIQREEAISTGYINFAVPHGVSAEVSDQTVAVLIAPNGIVWSDKIIYCVMLMAVDPERLEEFQNMYNALLLLLMETDCVEKLRSISDFNQFRRIMTSQRLS
ncbi:MAG: PTS sugar transporter subunit IIA, partial [Erysipelotrichaceae bacterium]|nr:PTS sugar transporter subunit IIA [Erysipelotrichaceae bacterium]